MSTTYDYTYAGVMLLYFIEAEGWDQLYERNGNTLNGFPGVAGHIAESAILFQDTFNTAVETGLCWEDDFLDMLERFSRELVERPAQEIDSRVAYRVISEHSQDEHE